MSGTGLGRFFFLSKAKVGNRRFVIISRNKGEESFTIGHQILLEGPSGNTPMFLKGAILIEDLEALYDLRDAINNAIRKVEDGEDKVKDYPSYLDCPRA